MAGGVEDGDRRRAARAREQEAGLLAGWEKKVWPPVRPPDLSHAVGLTARRGWRSVAGMGIGEEMDDGSSRGRGSTGAEDRRRHRSRGRGARR